MSGTRDATPPLSRDDWKQLEPLLDALLDAPADQRTELLAELSGADPGRRRALEQLLLESERTSTLLDRPATARFGSLLDGAAAAIPEVLAGRYRIARELGHGGMATVHLARDLKHDRDVAVKIIRPEVAAALGRARFLREIAIVAQLHHPHIVPLYDSGEADGVLFYVMPYLDGHSLRERLALERTVPIAQAVVILRDVCDALAHAHERGLVHRDIKPDNVLLSGRHAMVTDFGVARAVTAAAERWTATGAGVLLGTPAYMAPEQATGDPKIDHRADIYAFGVLAYELLAGRLPFTGDNPQEIVSAHLVQTPEPLAALRADVPAPLADLVMRCLAKRPADRWQSADDVLTRLVGIATLVDVIDSGELPPATAAGARGAARRWAGARRFTLRRWAVGGLAVATLAAVAWIARSRESASPAPAIAVLLFQSGSPDLEPLALGLTSHLIGALGSASLDVRSIDAVWPYRGGLTPLNVVARRLDVQWIVGGTVLRLGDSVTVSADLTDAATGRLMERRQASTLPGGEVRLRDELVTTVATMLRERIGQQVRLGGWKAGTRSEQAFDEVNRAYKAVRDADFLAEAGDVRGGLASLSLADSSLDRAASADPAWAEPLVQRAWVARKVAFFLYGTGMSRDAVAQAIDRGTVYAQAARVRAPNDPRVLEAHGMMLHTRWILAPTGPVPDSVVDAAQRLLTEASDADSSLVTSLDALSVIHANQGNFERARLLLARAHAADAYAQDGRQVLSRLFTYSFVGRDDAEARRWCAAYAREFVEEWFGGACRLQLMAWDSTQTADIASAWSIARASTALAPEPIRSPVSAQLEMLVAGVVARSGLPDSARRVLATIADRVALDSTIARVPFDQTLRELEAAVRVQLGEPDAAIALLAAILRTRPDRRVALSRDRRFRDLPFTRLDDATPRGS